MNESLRLKCPRCKSKNYDLVETFEEHVIFRVIEGKMPREVLDKQAGSIIGVGCECLKCKHMWKPRGVSSWPDAVTAAHSATRADEGWRWTAT